MNPTDLSFLKTNVALLADFSDAHREETADGSRVVLFGPGEIIVHAGDEMHFLGVVIEGKIAASVPRQDGGRQTLGHFGPGETFGEMALVGGREREYGQSLRDIFLHPSGEFGGRLGVGVHQTFEAGLCGGRSGQLKMERMSAATCARMSSRGT